MREFNPDPKTLVSIISPHYHGQLSEQLLVSDIQLDSREVAPGSLFIAMQGTKDHGEKYIFSAVENGAVAVIVENADSACDLKLEVPVIGIENLKREIPNIALSFFEKPSNKMAVYGVTGTNGKSTISSFIAQLNQLLNLKSAAVGTLGYGLIDEKPVATGMTTPDVVSCQRILAELKAAKAKVVAMEVSSHGIDQGRTEGIEFCVGVISNITRDHLDYHGSFESYADVKRNFILSKQCKTAVVNSDDPECETLLAALPAQKKKFISYGIESTDAEVFGKITGYSENGIEAELKTPWGSADVNFPMLGDFNFSNALAALSACCLAGRSFEKVVEVLPFLRPVSGRLEKVDVGLSNQLPRVYIDYAHTPDALEQVLRVLKNHVTGKLWVVFGCGGDRDKGKRAPMGAAACKYADYLIVTSDNPRSENPASIIEDILVGVTDSVVESVVQRDVAISLAIGSCQKQDLILIAGKGHEDYQIIGDKTISFSDVKVARKALLTRRNSLGASQ